MLSRTLPGRSSSPLSLTVGLVLASVALLGACLQATLLSGAALAATSGALLHTGQVGGAMEPRTQAAISAVLPGGQDLDPAERGRVVDAVYDEPAFRAAFAGGLAAVSRQVLHRGTSAIALDPGAVRAGVLAALTKVDPTVGAEAAAAGGPGPTVTFDTASAPDLAPSARTLRVLTLATAIAGAVLVVVGVALSEQRAQAIGRIGRWVAVAGLAVVLLFWLVPVFAMPRIGGWTEVAGVVTSAGSRLLVPGLVMIAVGSLVAWLTNRFAALRRGHALAVIPKAPTRRAGRGETGWRDTA